MYQNKIVRYEMMNPRVLKAHPKNWREHPKQQAEGLDGVLTDVGWVDTVLYNEQTGHIIDGHLRIELALKNHESEVPVLVVNISEEEEEKVLATHDPLTAMARTNHATFAALIAGIKTTNPAVRDLIDRIRAKNCGAPAAQTDGEDPEGETRVKPGDMWKLGRHRLICGDATDPEVWDRLLGDKHAEMCLTSPPYNVGVRPAGYKGGVMRYLNDTDDKTPEEYLEFLSKFMRNAMENCDEVFLNIGLATGNKAPVLHFLDKYAESLKDVIYWLKDTAAPHIQEGVINNRVEPIYCFGDGTRKFKYANFLQGTYFNVISGKNASDNQFTENKATFPSYLPINLITHFSHSGHSVVDPFLGTGTTLMACEIEGRTCYGIDIEPRYLDIALAKFEKTGQKAEKL